MPQCYSKILKKSTITGLLTFFIFTQNAAAIVPNDASYAYQSKIWQQVGAEAAWEKTTGSADVALAVIDTGLDARHADLAGNLWQNPGEILNGEDDDNNGFVDDINGWNFVEENNNIETPTTDAGDDPGAVHHGTVTAGLAGAVGNNGLYGTGINWQVKIMPLRAIKNNGSGSLLNVAKAVDYAMKKGADVISLSLVGSDQDEFLEKTLRRAYDKGIVLVAAAGNKRKEGEGNLDEYPIYPICADLSAAGSVGSVGENWLLGATSVDGFDRLSDFASYGKCVDLAAPGEGIYSTERYSPAAGYNEQFGGAWGGTSFAVPIVAGAAALVKSARPEWRAKEIINALLSTADKIDAQNPGFAGKLGYGRLNIAKAVDEALKPGALADQFRDVYFISQNVVYRRDLAGDSQTIVSKVGEARALSLAMLDTDADGAREIAVLLQRGKFYYIRLMYANGAFIREFSLPPEIEKKPAVAVEIKAYPAGSGIVARMRKNGDGNDRFYLFDLTGKQKLSVKAARSAAWEMTSAGELALAYANKGKMRLEIRDWKGKRAQSWNLNRGANKIWSLQRANLWGEGAQWALVTARGNDIEYTVADFENSSFFTASIGENKKGVSWGMMIGPLGTLVLPYNSAGGAFGALDGRANGLKYFELPAGMGSAAAD